MCNINIYKFLIAFLSIVAGAVIAILFYFGFIEVLNTALLAAVIIAAILIVLTIIFLLIPKNNKNITNCLCKYGDTMIFGGVGTIVFAIIAFSVTLATASILSAILVFITFFFFFLTLISFLFLIDCIICKKCSRNSCSCNLRTEHDRRDEFDD